MELLNVVQLYLEHILRVCDLVATMKQKGHLKVFDLPTKGEALLIDHDECQKFRVKV